MPVSGLRSEGGELPALRSHPGGLRPQPVSWAGDARLPGHGDQLRPCQLRQPDHRQSYFCEAHLTGNNFSYANFESCLLERCELAGNRWQGPTCWAPPWRAPDLSGSEFGQIDWTSFNLQGCDLRQCDLPGLDLRRVNLAGVQINEDQQQGLLEQIGLVVFP